MLLTIKKIALLKLLRICSDAIPTKSNEACFLNFKITVENQKLSILASDGDISIKATQEKTDEDGSDVIFMSEDGSTQVNAKLFLEIISKLGGDIVTLELVDTTLLTISDKKTTYNINSKLGEEYPDIEIGSPNGDSVQISSKDFKELYKKTYFAVAQKSSRAFFLGINIKCYDNKISFMASDSCRLARKTLPIDSDVMLSFNCPLKVLSIIDKIETPNKIKMQLGADKVTFYLDNVTIGSKIIPGEFPDADKIIPTHYGYVLRCSAESLIGALDRVCVVVGDDKSASKIVKFSYNGESADISSYSTFYGNSCEKLDDCEFEGDRFAIHFNSQFVKEACLAHDSEQIEIRFTSEAKLFVVASEDENNLQLITPIRMNS